MDFIERYLGLSPDGGDGTLEYAMMLLLSVLIGVAGMSFAVFRKPKDDRKK